MGINIYLPMKNAWMTEWFCKKYRRANTDNIINKQTDVPNSTAWFPLAAFNRLITIPTMAANTDVQIAMVHNKSSLNRPVHR